mmetsp:Transcript_865/g.2377  ORF Transcript_865/g.2377 Transcript_865/m.2377 type:complete len:249 (+) Transcript_865:199-945(+)
MFDIHGDGLVGVRVNTSANITLLIISTSAQSISDVNASAERALQNLLKLKVTDPVMVVDQQGFPQTFVPQEYPLGVVTNIVRDLGGILTTKQKGDSVLATIPARTNGAGRGRSLKNDNVPLSSLLEGLANGGGKKGKPEVGLFQAKRRKDRLKPFKFGPSELAELAVGLRAYVTSKRETSAPVTSWSNLLARKWPREYALAKQAAGFKCTAQKVREAIDANLLNRYGSVWQWQGGWPAEAEKYPACSI